MRTSRNLPRHELIGLEVGVVQSRNEDELGIRGKVVDETKQTLVVESGEEAKRIEKEGRVFQFDLPSGKEVRVDGIILKGRPEERIGKKLKKWT